MQHVNFDRTINPRRRLLLGSAACITGEAVLRHAYAQRIGDMPMYRGNQHRFTRDLLDWHQRAFKEAAQEPSLPIVDAHHHLFGESADDLYYRTFDMERDLNTGHKIMGTVYVAAYGAGWRSDGPAAMRSVGEVERILRLSETPLNTEHGACRLAAGIVSDVDLTLDEAVVDDVLQAHVAAAQGRLSGVRYYTTWTADSELAKFIPNRSRTLMQDSVFRRSFARLAHYGLCFDALVYHTQLRELAALADAFPDTPIVLNHVGMPIGVLGFRSQQANVRQAWERDMRILAQRPNVRVKVGGMGMPIFGFGFEAHAQPANTQALVLAWKPLVDVCIDAFGPDRCMLESNFPVDKQSCGYVQLWNALKEITRSLSKSERQALFYRTACRTYRLPELEAACDAAMLQ